MRIWVVFALLAASGCSYTFDSTEPELQLIGEQPDTPSMPHVNTDAVVQEWFVRGFDDAQWLIMQHVDGSYRILSLTSDAPADVITKDQFDDLYTTPRKLYLVKANTDDMGPPDGGVAAADEASDMGPPPTVTLTIRAAGDPVGQKYIEPAGSALLYVGGTQDDVFTYMVSSKKQPGYIIQRRDSDFRRIIAWPKGVDPSNPYGKGYYFWDSGQGRVFYDMDADNRLVAHSALDNTDIDLGIHSRSLAWVNGTSLASCGDDGVRIFAVDGKTPESLLTDEVCVATNFWISDGFIYYDSGTNVRKVALDHSAAPETVYDFGTNRVLSILSPNDTIFYSKDPASLYVHGAGDGWLVPKGGGADFKFMNRGTGLSIYNNLTQLNWLENSAQESGAGELMGLTLPAPGVPGGTKVPLARNVRSYGILGDGRILCDDDHAFDGTQNRIVVLDPLRHHAQWVASSSNYVLSIPTTDDFLVEVVSGDLNSHDLVRVSLPPIVPTPPPNQ
jgi:hypothetical protein